MSAVTKETIISKAKSLVGTDEGSGCDIMKWYGGFSTAINNVACCCAGMMYLFNKCNALDMLYGKTASCGVIAQNFYNNKRLFKPSEVKAGDLVIFSWSGSPTSQSTALRNAGFKTFDHIELCIAVNGDGTITTIGANNGGAECDDFQRKTRYISSISGCCRPKYINESEEKEEMIEYGKTNNATLSFKQHIRTLKAMGVINQGVDNNGCFGEGTQKAVKEIQKAAGITVDGIVGKNTINAVYDLETKAYKKQTDKIANAKKALN